APGPSRSLAVRVPQVDRGSYAVMPESTVTFDKSRGGKTNGVDLLSNSVRIIGTKRSVMLLTMQDHHRSADVPQLTAIQLQ
ncbi:hypothetical protein BX616_009625, partial [Lobosporangium transversale]